MDNSLLNGMKFALGILLVFSILGIVSAVGFHVAEEIQSGTFNGNYGFIGNVDFSSASITGLPTRSASDITSGVFTGSYDFSGNLNLAGASITGLPDMIPSGAIMAFNLNICPSGWTQANGGGGRPDLRGVFLRGMETFDGGNTYNSRDPDRGGAGTLRSYQGYQIQTHKHYGLGEKFSGWPYGQISSGQSGSGGGIDNDNSFYGTTYTGGSETRPKNVAVIFCVKD